MGESIIKLAGLDRLPCQLLLDGRMERVGGSSEDDWARTEPTPYPDAAEIFNDEVDGISRTLLPAQGALFVTNYRVIFIGVPKDPFRMSTLNLLTIF